MAKEQEGSTPSAVVPGGTADGAEVLQEVAQMTGLPGDYLNTEISEFLGTNQNVNELSLDQLRAAILNFLEAMNDEITQSQSLP